MENLTIDGLQRQAARLLKENRMDMRWFVNRGLTASCAVSAVSTLHQLGLIDECDLQSIYNEYGHLLQRRYERCREGLPVLGG